MSYQLADGVAYLHSRPRPVVHRDLKSMNVLLAEDGVKLCDFGLTQSMEHTCLTRKPGGESGSPRYSPPEIFLPQAAMTEKVDIWSLGCVLIELWGGPIPYSDCTSIQQIMHQLLIAEIGPALPQSAPLAAVRAMETCLMFVPDERATADTLKLAFGHRR